MSVWSTIKASLIVGIDETHPDALSSRDLRSRGYDPVNGVLEYQADHDARMNERAERLGYTR